MFKFDSKTIILSLSISLFSLELLAKFPSTVPELNVANSHYVAGDVGTVYRGSSPLGHEQELADFNVTDILIFKNQTNMEVDKEVQNLKAAGYSSEQIHHIPFRWKDVGEFKSNCEQIVDALKIVSSVLQDKEKKLFFHCTVGEDRTGLLSGLVQQISSGTSVREAHEEMCMNGYEAGNPTKPTSVNSIIQSQLTPLYLKMSYLIETGQIDLDHLDRSVCANDPGNSDDYANNPLYNHKKYRCKPSDRYQ